MTCIDDFQNKLKHNFAFYTAYHRHPYNQLIHITTIPLIIWTIFIFLAYVPIFEPKSDLEKIFYPTPSLLLIVGYLILYYLVDSIAATCMALLIFLLYVAANAFRFFVPYAYLIAIVIHGVAWVLQFMGHGVFEGRKPALLDGLLQAFTMAPLFALMEGMFYCGYKPDLKNEINCMSYQYEPVNNYL